MDWGIFIGVLIPIAVLVYWYGNVRAQRVMSERNTEPRGRRSPRGHVRDDPQFTAMVGRMMQRGLVTPIAEASAGPVLLRGVLTAADATLGGAPGRECVWQNRSDAPRDAAVCAEYVVIADTTGRATVENLALADIVAPEEKLGPHRAYCSLRLGDEIEVVGRFKPERFGEDPDPTRLIYGSVGGDGLLHVRLSRRDPVAGDTVVPSPDALPSRPAEEPPRASDESHPRDGVDAASATTDPEASSSRDDLPPAKHPSGATP